MADIDTSPAALRALAERLSDEDEHLDCLHQYDSATLCRKAAAVLAALAAEKEAGAPDSAFLIEMERAKEWLDHTAPAAPAPDADGWIPWEGGECPVAQHVSVDVKFRTGEVDPCYPAAGFDWSHGEQAPHDDIIAYRIAKEG